MQYGYTIKDDETEMLVSSTDTEELKQFAIGISNGKSHHSVLNLIDPAETVADGTWDVLTAIVKQNYAITVERWAA